MNIIDERIKKLRELMSEKDISFYIIPTADYHGSEYIADYFKCREYMSGFTGSAGTLVVSKDEAALFVDGRYHIQADNETEGTCINVYKLGVKGVPSLSTYLAEKTSANEVIGYDGRVVMQSLADSLCEKSDAKVDCEADLISSLVENRTDLVSNTITLLPEEITGKNTLDKIEEIRKVLKEKNADSIFLSSLDDICYVFNIRGNDVEYNPVVFSYAYITDQSVTLYLMSGAYDETIVNHFSDLGIFIADYSDVLSELFKIKGKKIAVDKDYTSSYFYKVLSIGNEVYDIHNCDIVKKHIKTEAEQELARKYAVSDAVALIEYIVSLKTILMDGLDIDEYEASELLYKFRSNMKGFISLSFDTICAYAENAAIVHYSASQDKAKKLQNKGLLLIDSGSQYFGATTDITRTIVLGELTEEEKIAYTLVLKGNLKLMDSVFIKGTRCENLDILARESLWKVGLDYRHGTGHGIGSFLNVHEGPYRIGYKIRENMPQPDIEPGMIISDEPGYYEDGKFGIRHETQLLCVKKIETEYGEFYGFEPLSLVPFEKDAIVFEMLTLEEFEILNRYNQLIIEKVRPYLSEDGKRLLDYNTNYVD